MPEQTKTNKKVCVEEKKLFLILYNVMSVLSYTIK